MTGPETGRLTIKVLGVLVVLWLFIHGPNLPGALPMPTTEPTLDQTVVGVVVVGAILLMFTGLGLMLTPEAARPVFIEHPSLRLYLAAILAVLGVSFALEALTVLFDVGRDGGLGEMNRMMARLQPWERGVAAFAIGVGPGVTEELCFRGWLMSRLDALGGRWWALTLSSAVFGLFHFDLLYALVTAIMGLTLGFCALRTGSLGPAIAAHTVNNAFSVATAGSDAPSWMGLLLLAGLFGGWWGVRTLAREPDRWGPSVRRQQPAFHAPVDGEDGTREVSSELRGAEEGDGSGHVLR